MDNDYVSRTGQKENVPVQTDEAAVEDPIDPATADSDATLGKPLSRISSAATQLTLPQRKMKPMLSTNPTLLRAVRVVLRRNPTANQAMMRGFLVPRMVRVL